VWVRERDVGRECGGERERERENDEVEREENEKREKTMLSVFRSLQQKQEKSRRYHFSHEDGAAAAGAFSLQKKKKEGGNKNDTTSSSVIVARLAPRHQHCDVAPVEQDRVQPRLCPAPGPVGRGLDGVVEHHVHEGVEPAQRALDLAVALEQDPQPRADAAVEELRGEEVGGVGGGAGAGLAGGDHGHLGGFLSGRRGAVEGGCRGGRG